MERLNRRRRLALCDLERRLRLRVRLHILLGLAAQAGQEAGAVDIGPPLRILCGPSALEAVHEAAHSSQPYLTHAASASRPPSGRHPTRSSPANPCSCLSRASRCRRHPSQLSSASSAGSPTSSWWYPRHCISSRRRARCVPASGNCLEGGARLASGDAITQYSIFLPLALPVVAVAHGAQRVPDLQG